jgi:spore coat polysaccharide biosynthesis predicted glycosyltransferase SpsG
LYADYVINPQRESEMQTPSNQLSGTDYLVMRDEFKHQSPDISPRAEKVLITFGGSDPLDLTLRIVGALGPRKLPFSYKLVIGPDFGSRDELERLPDEWMSKFEVLSDVSNMGRLMAWADVAISSGGRTVYELAATGTPSIVIAQNNGEVERMGLLREQEAIEFLGYGRDVSLDTVPDRLTELANDRQRRSLMSERAQELVDGRGVQRIIDLVHKILIG